MSDDLREGILREQRGRGQAILESDRKKTNSIVFDAPIVVSQMKNYKRPLPSGYSSIAAMFSSTECWVEITLNKQQYEDLILDGEEFVHNIRSVPLNESRKFLSILDEMQKRIGMLKKKLESSRIIAISELEENNIRTEIEEQTQYLDIIFKNLILKVSNIYGTVLLKVDDHDPEGFFAIDYYPWNGAEPRIHDYWPYIEAPWSQGKRSGFIPPNVVFNEILERHAQQKEGEERWNTGRSQFQILRQIQLHLDNERAYYENPKKLEKVNAHYDRCELSSNDDDGSSETGYDRFRLALTDTVVHQYFTKEENTFTIKEMNSNI